MGNLKRYGYVYAFAIFFIGLAVIVGRDQDIAHHFAERLVQDTLVIVDATDAAITDLKAMDVRDASEEAIALFVKAVQSPSRLLETVGDSLEDARRRMSTRHPDLFTNG
ncbi:hypothetical protein GCM10011316_13380 [Roseibium aquae]|uniref:Uncharacterized protein n=1 Tax=Roseibium aquae TaxID=1323746 RepID=A0A916TG91_9HYPH|nr:hypothetical protein [Roseibium aquae]GGB42789.1 hypothetical protein GCM10011316_13380 [Roseibium aquae]